MPLLHQNVEEIEMLLSHVHRVNLGVVLTEEVPSHSFDSDT